MTNNDISHVLSSIAEAKRALDLEPTYLERLGEYERRVQQLSDTVADRELRIHTLKQTETDLIQKLRSVEAERDDAGFRALEEADKVQGLLTVVRQFVGDGLKIISAVEGTEQTVIAQSVLKATHDELASVRSLAEDRYDHITQLEHELLKLKDDMRFAQEQLQRPLSSTEDTATAHGIEGVSGSGEMKSSSVHDHEAEALAAKPYAFPPQAGWRDADPTAQNSVGNWSGSGTVNEHGAGSTDAATTMAAPSEGQSDGPFAETTQTAQSLPATSTSAELTTDAASNASPPERNRDESTRFKGRKYFDVTYFVPLHEWLNKGGEREDYYWRPDHANDPLPQSNRASHNS